MHATFQKIFIYLSNIILDQNMVPVTSVKWSSNHYLSKKTGSSNHYRVTEYKNREVLKLEKKDNWERKLYLSGFLFYSLINIIVILSTKLRCNVCIDHFLSRFVLLLAMSWEIKEYLLCYSTPKWLKTLKIYPWEYAASARDTFNIYSRSHL